MDNYPPSGAPSRENELQDMGLMLGRPCVMESDSKESIDGLMKLADFRMARIVSRREHEWKVTVAFWAVLAAGIAKPPTLFARKYSIILVFLLGAIVAAHTGLWVYPHWKRSKEDIDQSFQYTDHVERILGGALSLCVREHKM